MKATVRKILLASLAVASLTAFSGSTQASTTGQTSASEQGWCDIVPTFCDNHCGHGGLTAQQKCKP